MENELSFDNPIAGEKVSPTKSILKPPGSNAEDGDWVTSDDVTYEYDDDSDDEDDVVREENASAGLQGNLLKSPAIDSPDEGQTMRNWRKRWFVYYDLSPDPSHLEYYKDQYTFECGDKPKGVIDMANVIAVLDVPGRHRYPNLFLIQTTARKFFLSAPNPKDLRIWITTLSKELHRIKNSAKQPTSEAPTETSTDPLAYLTEPWYYGQFSRSQAEAELKKMSERAGPLSILRDSSDGSGYALSWTDGREIGHSQILRQTDGSYAFNDPNGPGVFATLTQLMDSSKVHQHFKGIKPVTWAIRRNEASQPQASQISLVTTQPVSQPRQTVEAPKPTFNTMLNELERLRKANFFLLDQQFEMESFEAGLDQLTVLRYLDKEERSHIKIPNFMTDWNGRNMYTITDQTKEMLFFVSESADDPVIRSCCGVQRPFSFGAFGTTQGSVFTFQRKRGYQFCCLSWCGPCLPAVTVRMNDWEVGSVQLPVCGGGFKPTYYVCDADGTRVLKIVGPFKSNPSGTTELQILQKKPAWTQVGKVTRKQKTMAYEMATDADRFKITFPETLSIENKVTLLAAVVFIDYMQYEGRAAANTVGNVPVPVKGAHGEEAIMYVDVEREPCCQPLRICNTDLFCCGCVCRC